MKTYRPGSNPGPDPDRGRQEPGREEQARVLAALAGRIDATERRLSDHATDIAGLGRGLARVLTHLDHPLDPSGPGPDSGPGSGPGAGGRDGEPGGGDEAEQGEGEGQRDWARVSDPALAAAWLIEVDTWTRQVAVPAGLLAPLPTCWALHPVVVIDLLALHTEHDTAWSAEVPTPVSEWLGRWLPATRTRLAHALRECIEHRHHRHTPTTSPTSSGTSTSSGGTSPGGTSRPAGGVGVVGRVRGYDATGLDLVSIAGWWASTHGHPSAPETFHLTPLD